MGGGLAAVAAGSHPGDVATAFLYGHCGTSNPTEWTANISLGRSPDPCLSVYTCMSDCNGMKSAVFLSVQNLHMPRALQGLYR